DALSVELIRSNRLPEARSCLHTWLDRQPNDPDALARRAWVAEELFDYPAALDDFAKALAVSPDQDQLRLHVAELLIERNLLPEALEHLQNLVGRQPENPGVL